MRFQKLIVTASFIAGALAQDFAFAQNVIEGRKAWLRLNCYGCHGNSGEGGMGPRVRGQDATNIRNAMRGDNGAGGMRPYTDVPGVKPTDFEDMAAYLRSIGTTAEPKWYDWWRR